MQTLTETRPASTQQTGYSRVFDLLDYSVCTANRADALVAKEAGTWRSYSAQEFTDLVNQTSLGLLQLGVRKDDKIAIISANRPEWNIVDFGMQQLGAVSVPMYPTITVEDYRFIFQDSGTKIVFVANQVLYDKVVAAIEGLTDAPDVYTFDVLPGAQYWRKVLEAGQGRNVSELEPYKQAVQPEDLLTLIYTSGTTGTPKGVMLTHHNILSNVDGCLRYFPASIENGKALSFLPMCHIYERTCLYVYLRKGIGIYYAESMDTIADNLREVKPDVFTTVPRLLEKVYDRIVAKGYELTGLKKRLFFWALQLGLQYDPTKPMGWWYDQQLAIARKLIFSKWQQALGGNVKMICSGAAALQPRLSRVFWAAGIRISEGYGLTETSPVISTSLIDPVDFRVGCVGTVLEGVHVKIAEDGEILVKGPNVMKGYYKQPEKTAEVMSADGYFHTGDIGELVEGRFLKITDRKKEIFKTSGGKYVAPQLVENKLKESRFIEQAIVVGEGQKFPSALLVPDFAALKTWCELQSIPYESNEKVLTEPRVLERFESEVAKANASIAQYEQVKKFRLLSKPFTVETGEMTPKLSLKRRVITAKYQDLIDGMYA
jgi:long-chain acyl-CoA synthetase